MIVLLAIAAWSVITLLIGLVTGDPFLRTGGAAVLCLTVGAAWLLDRLAVSGDLWLEEDVADFDRVEFDWPERDERRAA